MSRWWMFAIALALFGCSLARAQSEKPAVDPNRLAIGRTGGPLGGWLTSEKMQSSRPVLHGLQVRYGPRLQITEYSVYNEGRCEQLVQFHANGQVFREQWRDHEGNGSEAIYSPRPIRSWLTK